MKENGLNYFDRLCSAPVIPNNIGSKICADVQKYGSVLGEKYSVYNLCTLMKYTFTDVNFDNRCDDFNNLIYITWPATLINFN
jgi:hypothetical protein